jgi:NAD(P)-dependent dehydrogenase (short-subunit alcohol dehydrogenase family)
MTEELLNKVAIVTGGASGIGSAAAQHFLSEGARVVIADVNCEDGEAVAAELGTDCVFKYADVSRRDNLINLVAFTAERFGALAIMFNNAGVSDRWYLACSMKTSLTSTELSKWICWA